MSCHIKREALNGLGHWARFATKTTEMLCDVNLDRPFRSFRQI